MQFASWCSILFSSDRCHRLGQERPVTVYNVCLPGSLPCDAPALTSGRVFASRIVGLTIASAGDEGHGGRVHHEEEHAKDGTWEHHSGGRRAGASLLRSFALIALNAAAGALRGWQGGGSW